MKYLVFFAAAALLLSGCVLFDPLAEFDSQIEMNIPKLAAYQQSNFLVGAAVGAAQLDGAQGALLRRHFNSLTAENAMKFLSIQPRPGRFNFEEADKLADFARKYNMQMRGHTFVWHHPQVTADWIFEHPDGSPKSREEVLALLEEHITQLMTRYSDVVTAWDVVNEAIDVNEPDGMRRTRWYEAIGPDYVEQAFLIAHRVNPDAKLFYNDYSVFDPIKGDAIYRFVKAMKDKGIPVHGIGMQNHVTLTYPEVGAIEFAIQRFKQLGLEIHITELDMSLYTQEFEVLENPPQDYLIRQAYRYKELFDVYAKHRDAVKSVTFWGLSDPQSWLRYENVSRGDWPLLFDDDLRAKLAFHALTGGSLPADVDIKAIKPPQIYQAPKGTPRIDGEVDAVWANAPVVSTDIQVMQKPGAVAKVRVLWDEDYLYFLSEVADPLLNDGGSQRHEQDSFEVFIDENNGKTAAYEADDYQFRWGFNDRPSFGGRARLDMMQGKAVVIPGGYRIEMAIKMTTVSGRPGLRIGMDFQVNDADESKTRVGITKWNDPTNESWRNTSGWGVLELVP